MQEKVRRRRARMQKAQIHVVVAQGDGQGRPWISGVFARLERAEAYLQEIPEPVRSRHVVSAVEHRFPVFALEDTRGFRFFDKAAIVEAVSAYRSEGDVADEDYQHAVLYCFKKGYRPEVPGADEMGRVWHWHLTNERLAQDDSWLLALVK
jgi:hypothetical protein